MIILGLNDMSQDASACIMRDGELVAAVTEERVSRIKHCGGFPDNAIHEALRIAGIRAKDVDRIAVGNTSTETLMRLSTHVLGVQRMKESTPDTLVSSLNLGMFTSYRKLVERYSQLRSVDSAFSQRIMEGRLRRLGIRCEVEFHDHHRSHAASAFFTSGFRNALVVTLDAYGDGRGGAVFFCNGQEMEEIASFPPEVSLGEFYGAITAMLGYRFGNDEGKTMALAALGRPLLKGHWRSRIWVEGMSLRGDLTRLRRFTLLELSRLLSDNKPEDIAASAQAILEETVCTLVENAIEQTGTKRLCLAGGVFLNVILNMRLMELNGIKEIHVFPAPGDDGTAVGSALLSTTAWESCKRARLTHSALGTAYSREDVENALRRHPARTKMRMEEYDPDEVAASLSRGELVGWFNGPMEFGPRALGHRSLLADPRSGNSSRRIRLSIKRRPEFQPFCPSVTPRFARKLLVNPKRVPAPFMALAFQTHQEAAQHVPAVVHVDGTCRPHVVQRASNKQYHDLLRAFGEATGRECLLNTSLNQSGQPIVGAPGDVLDLLVKTDMDLLVMEGLTITKENLRGGR